MIVLYVILILAGVYLVFFVGPGVYMFHYIFHRKEAVEFIDMDLTGTPREPYIDRIREDFAFFASLPGEPVQLTAFDGTPLAARYYAVGKGKLAVCMHGYHSTAMNCFSTMGQFLMDQGYDLLLPDERAHGKSGGNWSGMGLLEQRDVLSWTRWACQREDISQVLLVGVSMGCAAVAYASDQIADPKVRAMILDCGFISPHSQINTVSEQKHAPAWLLMHIIAGCARSHLKINIRTPVWESLERTKLPALFLHGTKDVTVHIEDGESNFAHCASPKEFYAVEGGGHADAFLAGGEELTGAVKRFLDTYV